MKMKKDMTTIIVIVTLQQNIHLHPMNIHNRHMMNMKIIVITIIIHQQKKNPSLPIVVPIDFETIQEAIDAADEGDVIKVLPGTYTEQLNITKSLTIIGSGAKSTIIEAPTIIMPNEFGRPYIVEVNNGAEVSMKGFTVKGLQGTECGTLVEVFVRDDATLKLDSAVIKGCTQVTIRVGEGPPPNFPGPEVGNAIVTNTVVSDYSGTGVVAIGSGSSLSMSYSKIIRTNADGFGNGIAIIFGAKGIITHNHVSGHICIDSGDPDFPCGPDFFTQTQLTGIIADLNVAAGSVISNNYVSNNDAGITIGSNSGCCIIDHNKLTDNGFFGISVIDSEHTVSNAKIFGGKVGAAAIALSANTTSTLDQVKIIGTEIPIQALSTGNLTAAVNVLSPSFFEPYWRQFF